MSNIELSAHNVTDVRVKTDHMGTAVWTTIKIQSLNHRGEREELCVTLYHYEGHPINWTHATSLEVAS